jgi:hypothetical protein
MGDILQFLDVEALMDDIEHNGVEILSALGSALESGILSALGSGILIVLNDT